MVFKEWFGKEDYKIYKLNADETYYNLIEDPKFAFSMTKINDNIRAFHFFDTEDDSKLFIREQIANVVDFEKADIHCPKCSRGYEGYNTNDEYNVQYEWSYKKECACGHTFKVKGEMHVTYAVESCVKS